MKQTNVLILSAGGPSSDVTSVFGEIPSGMIPINGKPAISLIIDELSSQGYNKFLITVGFKKELVEKFVSNRYARLNVKLIEVDHLLGPGDSISAALDHLDSDDVLIILGDTIVKDDLSLLPESCVYTSSDFIEPNKWCLVKSDSKGNIEKLYDKMKIEDLTGLYALTGVYYLQNVSLLKGQINKNTNRMEISTLLDIYKETEDIKCVECDHWYDIGHLDKYHRAKIMIANSRYFNNLELDSLLGVLTKKSSDTEKLSDELQWYKNVPKEISVLAPRILDYQLEDGAFLKMEYYGYPTLSELFVYGDLHIRIWKQIIGKLIDILKIFNKYKREVSLEEYRYIFFEKTQSRLNDLLTEHGDFEDIFSYEYIFLNGTKLLNYNSLEGFIKEQIDRLYTDVKENSCFLHGDFHFANILCDLKSGIIRLIDPRGKWGKSPYGDIRYDVAKLRHSVVGEYDLIMNDFFSVTREENRFELTTYRKDNYKNINEILDSYISESWDLNQIKMIEGLLFISMIPLHKDNKERRLAMYCKGLQNLNNVYWERKGNND